MARHSLPRGRHVLLAPVRPVDRPTAGEVHGVVGSAPLRRGIAVVAVVGGALSAAGVAAAPGPRLPDPAPTGPLALDAAALGLSARSTPLAGAETPADEPADGRAVDSAADDGNRDDARQRATVPRDDAPVLDPDAVASAVRQASEEGKRLAEKDRAEKDRAEKDEERAEEERAGADAGTPASGSTSASTGAAPSPARGGTASQFPGELIDTN